MIRYSPAVFLALLVGGCCGVPYPLDGQLDHLDGQLERATYPEITNFHQVAETETTITVEWDIDITTNVPLKYRLTINDLISSEFLCSTSSCSRTVNGLSACNEYKFSLVAVFVVREETNTPQVITANTEYSTPGDIANLADDGTQITWDAPSNANCISAYQVCYTSDFFISTTCVNVTDTKWDYTISAVSGCDTLTITVAGATLDGKLGNSSRVDVVTAYGIPSEPTNYEVSFLSDTELLLKWDLPVNNAACIKEFSIIFGPDVGTYMTLPYAIAKDTKQLRQQYQSTITGLNYCTYYRIQVLALSLQDDLGPPAIDFAQTEDSAPGAIPEISFEPDTESVTVSWGNGTSDACLGSVRICYSDFENGVLECEEANVDGKPNGDYTVSGLTACTSYPFIVQGISPEGKNGTITVNSTETLDVRPGPVRNLDVSTRSTTSLGVDWDIPLENSECVDQYVISYTNTEDDTTTTRMSDSNAKADYEDILSGLDPCVNYLVTVYAVSAGGKNGSAVSTTGATSDTRPSAPRNLQTVTSTKDSATFLWYAPIERFCVELYHMYFVDVSGGSAGFSVNYVGTDTHAEQYIYTFRSDDFLPCTTYNVELDAHNEAGLISDDALGQVTTAC